VPQVEEQIRQLQLKLEEMGKRDAEGAGAPAPGQVADCCVCLTGEREEAGLRCNAALGFGHFLCAECLQARMQLSTLMRPGDMALTAGM
jgi:hypothetical protein